MDPSLTMTAAQLRLAIGRLARRLRRHNVGGLTMTQLSAMASVESAGRIRLGELAATEGIAPATLSRIAGGLAELGYLDRVADPSDRRSGWVSLTPEGARVLEATRRERTAALASALARLPAAEVDTLRQAVPVLEALVESFEPGAERTG